MAATDNGRDCVKEGVDEHLKAPGSIHRGHAATQRRVTQDTEGEGGGAGERHMKGVL